MRSKNMNVFLGAWFKIRLSRLTSCRASLRDAGGWHSRPTNAYYPVLKRAVLLVCIISILVSPIRARVLCPRIISEHTADVTDLGRFRAFPAWRDKAGNDLALAIWQYLCDYETGLYHFNEILEGPDSFDEYATVRDPLKIMNVYNMAYCGIFGPVLDGIYQGVGFEQGRALGIRLWNHCATEVWYDGSWHYLDLDVRGCLRDATGTVVSMDQARTQRSLWVDPPIETHPFFPSDPDKDRVFKIYRDTEVDYCYRWFTGSHTMDYSMRQGESFARWWTPQGGRWHHLDRYNRTAWIRKLIETSPRGAKPNHRDFTPWNHGNGLFHYEPNLTDTSSDFVDGVYCVDNLVPGPNGLHLAKAGEAAVVFEVFTPYIMVAKINELHDFSDDSGASTVRLETHLPVTVQVSLDRGCTWKGTDAVEPGPKVLVDLTKWVGGTYGYLLKLSTQGAAGVPALRSLAIDTWVQVAPISLPRLRQGVNHLTYEGGDRYGRQTVPLLVTPNTADPADLQKHVVTMPTDYDPARKTERIRGEVILRLQAPSHTEIAWFSVGATFRTHQGTHASKTANRIAYAVGAPGDFTEIYRAAVPTWVDHWRYNWDGDVVLDRPAQEVYVRFHGDPGLNVMRACLHVQPERPPTRALQVVHEYRLGARHLSRTVDLWGPGSYTIDCPVDPVNVCIRLAVPSKRLN
jgi:hypothetical protein